MNHEIHEAHEKAETLAEIVAEMRIFRCRDFSTGKVEVCNAIANYFADRIEAAWKRERGEIEQRAIDHTTAHMDAVHRDNCRDCVCRTNSAAMRDALESFCTIAESDVQELVRLSRRLIDEDIYGGGIIQKIVSDIGKARAALAAPPRNCDVGTAGEQELRFEEHCNNYNEYCDGCPVPQIWHRGDMVGKCRLAWAQMPYEAANEKGGAR